MDECVHVAEGQQIILGIEAENFKHRLGPEDAATREIPVPQPASAAIQRRIDAAADRFVNQVSFARARCLPMEGEAENQDDKSGRR